ncbi:unnamed protein product [Urochloa humidicola]
MRPGGGVGWQAGNRTPRRTQAAARLGGAGTRGPAAALAGRWAAACWGARLGGQQESVDFSCLGSSWMDRRW